jgi:endonuclease/exonuclease/phosphatase family metal-dependent hydrolase
MRLRLGHYNIRDLGLEKLRKESHPQVQAALQVLRRFAPQLLSVNELDCSAQALALLLQGLSQTGLQYPYYYQGPTNSGLPTGLRPPFEQRGFGRYEGQYGMALLSQLPLGRARSFEGFPWRELRESYLREELQKVPQGFPLFSTNFFDVPLRLGDTLVRVLLLHATVPVGGYFQKFRNADQLRFLKAYIQELGGQPFVIMGDLNADPVRGEGIREAIGELLGCPLLQDALPAEPTFLEGGGVQEPALDEEGLSLRLDYILPSRHFQVLDAGLYRPQEPQQWRLVRQASDHFFLWMDVQLRP